MKRPGLVLDPSTVRPAYRWWGLAALTLAVFVLAVDATVLNFAIPALSADLQPTTQQLLWIVDIYAFCVASLLITCGTFADRIGAKKLLLMGAVVFGVVSLAAGLATSPAQLIVLRALQGMAGATLMPSTLSLIGGLFSDSKERASAVAAWIAIYALGAAAGPLIGGILIEHFVWGTVFFINVPACALLALGVWLFVPESGRDTSKVFDIPGAAGSIIALFAFVYALKVGLLEGINTTIVLAIMVSLAAGWFFYRRITTAAHPLIDPQLFASKPLIAVVTANFMLMFVYVGVLFFITQYLQVTLNLGAWHAAWFMAPGLGLGLLATILTGRVMHTVSARLLILIGLGVIAAGCVLLAVAVTDLVGAHAHAWLIAAGIVVTSWGVGMIDPVTNYFVVATAPKNKAGAAASLSETGYELGAAVGTAVLGAIVMMVFHRQLDIHAPGLDDRSSLAVAHEHATLAGIDTSIIDQAFSTGMLAASLFAAVATAAVAAACARALPRGTTQHH